ncbi:MAG: insulinase family protein, partial [Calditrichota bacterium]
MRGYFSNRYAPDHIVLACAGNFDWEKICSLAENSCNQWQEKNADRKLEHSSGSKKKERIEKENLVREHICLMSHGVAAQDPRRFAASLLGTIIGDDHGSRFFWEIVDKAVAETASMQFGAMDGTGAFCSYIRCD